MIFLPTCQHLRLRCPEETDAIHLRNVIFELRENDITDEEKSALLDDLVTCRGKSRRFFLDCVKTGCACCAYPCAEWATIPASLTDLSGEFWAKKVTDCPHREIGEKPLQCAEGFVLAHLLQENEEVEQEV